MGWYEAIKDAVKAADRLSDAELNRKLSEAMLEGAKLAEENARLRQENRELREQIETMGAMEYKDNVYWRKREDGSLEGPYCPKCRDGARKAARMSDRGDDCEWRCPVCDYTILKPGRRYPEPYVETRGSIFDR